MKKILIFIAVLIGVFIGTYLMSLALYDTTFEAERQTALFLDQLFGSHNVNMGVMDLFLFVLGYSITMWSGYFMNPLNIENGETDNSTDTGETSTDNKESL